MFSDKLAAGLKKGGDLPLNFFKESGLIMHHRKQNKKNLFSVSRALSCGWNKLKPCLRLLNKRLIIVVLLVAH